MNKITSLTAIILSTNAMSGTIVNQQQCPNLTSEGQSLVSKLNTLSQDLKQNKEYKPIAKQISNVNSLISSDTENTIESSKLLHSLFYDKVT